MPRNETFKAPFNLLSSTLKPPLGRLSMCGHWEGRGPVTRMVVLVFRRTPQLTLRQVCDCDGSPHREAKAQIFRIRCILLSESRAAISAS